MVSCLLDLVPLQRCMGGIRAAGGTPPAAQVGRIGGYCVRGFVNIIISHRGEFAECVDIYVDNQAYGSALLERGGGSAQIPPGTLKVNGDSGGYNVPPKTAQPLLVCE